MKRKIVSILIALAFGITHASTTEEGLNKRKDEKYLSLIQLIANPEKYDEEYVSVGGYLNLSREIENSLYLDENSFRNGMPNSIAIDLESSSADIRKRAKELDGGYVIVAAQFKAGPTAFSLGELTGVYYLAPAPNLD